jgi:hypothetical protein
MALSATHRLRPRSRLVAALCLFGVLALGALSARPDWHEAICHHHAHGNQVEGQALGFNIWRLAAAGFA